uniref:Uncharacterized protein n=1 Tax=Leersia perrieri TaxID=77586 RepID=A0A0D9V2Y3_9ORYZ
MSSADPFLAASSPNRLLPRTLAPHAASSAAASPSTARGALFDGISRPLVMSKELTEQARMALREKGDIGKLYRDGGERLAAAANDNNNQPRRRPAPERKRHQFTIKPQTNNPAQNVDFSELQNIEDPDVYFSTLDKLEKADKEIKRLRGEAPTETAYNHRAIEPPKMRAGLLRRKSVHSYKFSASNDTPDATEAPASQTETITESQLTQDDVHASSPGMTKEPISSRSSQHAIPDSSVREDSFDGIDNLCTLNYLLSAFKGLDETEEESLLRKTLQIREISTGKVCLPDFNVPGDMPARNTTEQKNPMSGHTLERTVSGSNLDQISQLEKRIFGKEALEGKHADLLEDDESDGSPESLLCKRSPVRHSSDAAEPEGATTDERPLGGSPIGVNKDSELVHEKDVACGHNILLEEDDMPTDYLVSSPHHLEGSSTGVLPNTPSRNVPPLNHGDGNSENQTTQSIHWKYLQKKLIPRIVLKYIMEMLRNWQLILGMYSPQVKARNKELKIRSRHQREEKERQTTLSIHRKYLQKKLAADISNALSPSKGEEQRGKNKSQLSKRRKRAAGEPGDLEIPTPNFEPENQPHPQEIYAEQQPARRNSPSQSNDKRQKVVQKRNKKQDLNRRKSLTDAGLAWQSGVRRSTRIRSEPLKYWLGERFVYGRIHGTMATVIGVKVESPSQGKMKVKSFVSEQYSDYLAESAKY